MSDSARPAAHDDRYAEIAAEYGQAIERLARAYEADPDKRRDLLQDIHLALWRSLASFDGRCSVRTWVYRVAHNTAISQVVRRRAATPPLVRLEDVEITAEPEDTGRALDEQRVRDRLMSLVHALKPIDREVIVLYLEGIDAAAIAEITGLSAANVATKVHRIKQVLLRRFHEGRR
jgi:RNA polymerase sigma-70 factor (ECF subfamily)